MGACALMLGARQGAAAQTAPATLAPPPAPDTSLGTPDGRRETHVVGVTASARLSHTIRHPDGRGEVGPLGRAGRAGRRAGRRGGLRSRPGALWLTAGGGVARDKER
jgi:hypothetical protein